MQKHSSHMANFFPCFNGLFVVTKANPAKSCYTLDLLIKPDHFSTFHTSLLCKYLPNDDELFPPQKLHQPYPIVTEDSTEEWFIDCIIEEQCWKKLNCSH